MPYDYYDKNMYAFSLSWIDLIKQKKDNLTRYMLLYSVFSKIGI